MVPNLPMPGPKSDEEVHWVDPLKFFDELPLVLDKVPPLTGEESLYAMIRAVLDAAGKDAGVKETLVDIAVKTEKDVLSPLLAWQLNGPPAGNGWYSARNNGAFGADYAIRTAIAKSNMYENRFNETKYVFTDFDEKGEVLNGSALYEVTFPRGKEPPADGFWSLTLYNAHHFYNANPLKRYSLGTKNDTLKRNADGSLTLYAGAKSPGADKETNWLPAPNAPFSLYIRCYWPKQSVIDGSWSPPPVKRVS